MSGRSTTGQGSSGLPSVFAATGVTRWFGSLCALRDVNFSLNHGEIHALVGENGAGKSTLSNIIAGAIRPSGGSMELYGEPYEPRSRMEGAAAGVAHVRQQLSLVKGLTVAENLCLGRPRTPFRVNVHAAEREISDLAHDLSLDVPAGTLVEDLPLPVRQQAEIVIAIAWGARMLILDEPSSALGPREVEALIELCLRLKREGKSIIYISHRLPELVHLADRLTVLRRGQVVVSGEDVREADLNRIAELMVGDVSLLSTRRRRNDQPGRIRLEVEHVSASVEEGVGLDDLSLTVRAGEIVGVVGVAGNGQKPLADVLTGQLRPVVGRVVIDGADITASPRNAIAAGVACLHEELSLGIAPALSVAVNAIARRVGEARFRRFGLVDDGAVERHTLSLAGRFDVVPPSPSARAGSLSGGNQQKLMAARELDQTPAVLVAHGPTKGLDPQAAKTMRDRISEVADKGGAVVVISSDIDEIQQIARRIIVLNGGAVTDRFDISEMNSARLGAAMSGLVSEATDAG